MIRFLLVFLLLPMHGLAAQPPRFRYGLREDPEMTADLRRTIDSLHAISDSVNRCPPRADTLWASNTRSPIPTRWLNASVQVGCLHSGLPLAVRRRLRDDPASLRFYERVAKSGNGRPEVERSMALSILSWSADPAYFPLFIKAATTQSAGLDPDSKDYNAAYTAIIALAPYLADSPAARSIVIRAVANQNSEYARRAGILALATANDEWSRRALRAVSPTSVNSYIKGVISRALAHAACPRGLVFVEWFGYEGQDYSKCELPPDYR